MPDNPRERKRRSPRLDKEDKAKLVARVLRFYEHDMDARNDDIEDRIQRIAKFRMWTEGKNFPWEDSSDVAVPDMMTHSLRVQDTLVNAATSARPPVFPKALQKADKEKQDVVANLTDFQFFIEQPGEDIIGEMADAFVNDGVVTVFTPWIKETREIVDRRRFPPIPDDVEPGEYLVATLLKAFPGAGIAITVNIWEYHLQEKGGTSFVSFYTTDDGLEMDILKEHVVYDGPRALVKEYEDVVYPPRAKNLQMPSPSNPGGAPHVILVDYPTTDEIRRLAKSKFYTVSKEDLDGLDQIPKDASKNDDLKDQKDQLRGTTDGEESRDVEAEGQHTLTRLTCFDIYDLDKDGIAEDIIWWILLEPKILLKRKRMVEMYPFNPPRRPFAENSFIPVKGRREGISLLETMEGLHNLTKILTDQTVDTGTITGVPFWFYRASGAMKPEILRLAPGEGYPLGDPQRDVFFPNLSNNQAAFGLNMISMVNQWQEKITMQGDMQFGRVPPGRSAALRTIGGQQILAGQGEARPERILRRFFTCLAEVFAQFHELNQAFLPKNKQILITGLKEKGQDPYQEITSTDQIKGRFQFDFQANAFNSSRQAMQESLQAIGQILINPLNIQLGILKPEGVYKWDRDMTKAWGHDADQYIDPPQPGLGKMKITAEEAISSILLSVVPDGEPLEGAVAHLQRLGEFMQDDRFGLLSPAQTEIFRDYFLEVRQKAQVETQQQQLQQAAQQFQQGNNQGQPGAPTTTPPADTSQPQVQGNELLDESLPSSGGGGVQ